jgi:hypothetical protein
MARALAEETCRLLASGKVREPTTRGAMLSEPPAWSGRPRAQHTKFYVVDAGSFEASEWLLRQIGSGSVCVLDFASDSEPGGGWRGNQTGTQEESLCRASSLGRALERLPYPIAAYGCAHVPDVVVFRGADGALLGEPFHVGVLAAALQCAEPVAPRRGLSAIYGAGASAHEEAELVEWHEAGVLAQDAVRRKDWSAAATHFGRCVELRPEWDKGHACLARAVAKEQEQREQLQASTAATTEHLQPSTAATIELQASTAATTEQLQASEPAAAVATAQIERESSGVGSTAALPEVEQLRCKRCSGSVGRPRCTAGGDGSQQPRACQGRQAAATRARAARARCASGRDA